MSKFFKNISYDRALEKAMRYCSFQERCVFDMENRFRTWNVKREDWDKLIDSLIDQDFLNEKRYVEAFVRGKFLIKKWGRNKIKAELFQKNISGIVVDKSIEAEILEDDYYKTIQQLIEKKKLLIIDDDKLKIKEKIFRYLSSKGYETELIFRFLN
ncbi:MAG: regulatory protein RecX [Flavobacteriales bacterium]